MDDGSSLELDELVLELLDVDDALSDEKLDWIELSALVRAVASVLLSAPDDSSLLIVEAIWLWPEPWGGGGGGRWA
ncbi:hypothetical protein MKK63_10940 [Methylobacterium sp. J-088]|uniref:hypothetical protein n=1 Tax=Methylobacterium sp. J-088 TaxID=2836664 RepID=UPI001FBB8A69|nr:hypothetical protein [Methylobacterium sp. J-088]MCJ2063225.1 hypothetical protein [Methylobacterium sp. J-088]